MLLCFLVILLLIVPRCNARRHNKKEDSSDTVDNGDDDDDNNVGGGEFIDEAEVKLIDVVSCSSFGKVKLEGDAFAHGHSKAAFFGKLGRVDVVLKRPYGEYLHSETTVTSFKREAQRIRELRGHPGVLHLFGTCLSERPEEVASVAERLTPWTAFVAQELPWCVLTHTAITAITLVDFLRGDWSPPRNRTAHGWMHCDLHHGAFAVTSNFVAKLVDYGGLMHRAEFPVEAAPCTGADAGECAVGFCMRTWHTRHHASLSEFRCNTARGQCPGFDPSAMLWVVCESMLAETMARQVQERRGSPEPGGVEEALRGCLQSDRERRWSPSAVANVLRDYLVRNGGLACLSDAGVALDPAYYLVDERITLDSLPEHAGKPRPVWMPPKSLKSLKPFPFDFRPR
jgi:hypothetical protein